MIFYVLIASIKFLIYYVNEISNKLVVTKSYNCLYLHNDNYAKRAYLCHCMKKVKQRVKRPHIHWNEVRIELGDFEVDKDFYLLLSKHPRMSKDRIAYNALKKHYSTTSLNRYRWLGVPLV